jgi:hypothetical protein
MTRIIWKRRKENLLPLHVRMVLPRKKQREQRFYEVKIGERFRMKFIKPLR